jgi:integrase
VADRQGRWSGKTSQMQASSLALFLRIVGNKPLAALTRQDCRDARNTIARLPPNLTKRFDAPIEEVIAAGHAPRGPKTTNSNIAAVNSMLEWCRREGLIPDNPARGLLLPVGSRPDLERDAFTPAELQMLFAQLAPSMGAQYWLPLVALYSGMRLEEIAQLRPADIREVQGIWVFDVNATGGKRLKTASSARLVPIHPRLLGILELREGSSLWPSLARGADGYWSSPFSKWFGRFKRRAGISSRRLTFHSLRHTFINELKQRGVDELTIRELVGHANPSITTGRYGKRLVNRPEFAGGSSL